MTLTAERDALHGRLHLLERAERSARMAEAEARRALAGARWRLLDAARRARGEQPTAGRSDELAAADYGATLAACLEAVESAARCRMALRDRCAVPGRTETLGKRCAELHLRLVEVASLIPR